MQISDMFLAFFHSFLQFFFDPETRVNVLSWWENVTNVFYNHSNIFQKYISTFFIES